MVLGAVRGVDLVVTAVIRVHEAHVLLDAAGPDPTFVARPGATEPSRIGAVDRSNVEVVAEGRAYRAMADPIALCVALELGYEHIQHVAEFTRELADSPAIAVTRRTAPPDPPAVDDDYVDCTVDGEVVRYSPAQAHSVLRRAAPGHVVAVRLQSIPTAEHGIAVDDAFFTDLSSIDNGAWLRRGVADTRGTVVALLAADVVADAAETLAELTGRPTRTIAGEPEAAAVGARTTPGLPPDAVVCICSV